MSGSRAALGIDRHFAFVVLLPTFLPVVAGLGVASIVESNLSSDFSAVAYCPRGRGGEIGGILCGMWSLSDVRFNSPTMCRTTSVNDKPEHVETYRELKPKLAPDGLVIGIMATDHAWPFLVEICSNSGLD